MKTYTNEELAEVLAQHKLWLAGGGGQCANLSRANLSYANLRHADLSHADLRGADLRDADLRDAVLSGAVLSGAVLRGADLSGADLSDAVLRGAVLSGADLRGAVLRHIKADFWMILIMARREVPALISALQEGKVDGSTYSGACACLCGTLENAGAALLPHVASSPAESWFVPIRPGDKPDSENEGGFRVKMALEWALEFCVLSGIEIPDSSLTSPEGGRLSLRPPRG